MRNRHRTFTATVEVDWSDIDDDELIDELNARGFHILEGGNSADWERLADLHVLPLPDRDRQVADLIYRNTGRIVRTH